MLGQKTPKLLNSDVYFSAYCFENVWKAPHCIIDSGHLLNNNFLHPHLGRVQCIFVHGSCWGKCEAFRASPGSEMEKRNWRWREALSPWDRFALSPSFIHTTSTSPAQPCWWWSRKSQCRILPAWSWLCAWCAGGNWGQKNTVGPDSGRLEYQKGFSDGSVGEESACNAGDLSSIVRLGRSARERIGYPLQIPGLPLWLSW